MNPLEIAVYTAELTAAILASLFYYKYKNTALKFFVVYLWYVIINEVSTHFLLKYGLVRFQLVNIYGFITAIFVIWTCRNFISSIRLRKLLLGLLILTSAIYISEAVYKGLNQPWLISKIMGPLIGLVALLTYLVSLFQTSSVVNPFRELFTYFLLGFALFFVASPVILVARIYFQENFQMSVNLSYIMGTIVILMYAIFSFGFVWSHKKTDKHSTR